MIGDLLFSLVPCALLFVVMRYGPVRTRWWRSEHPAGFALFVGGIAFLAGFVGPMIVTPGANQGPLLGIFITGPLGTVAGFFWGLARAAKRAKTITQT